MQRVNIIFNTSIQQFLSPKPNNMKQLLLPFFFALFLASCGDKGKVKSVQKNEDGTTTTTTVDTEKMTEASNEMEKKMEELKKLPAMSTDQLKALLPEEVQGIKRSNFNASSMMGYGYAEGEYQVDDTTSLKIDIYDCAGEAGSGIYGLNYWSKMSFQQESSKGYTKTIDFMGDKAVEQVDNDMNQSTLTYFANERLLVVLTGRNMKPDKLKDAAKSLNLKVS